jgi:ferrochelatase
VTSRLLADELGLNTARWEMSYQSRLGRLPWLSPYTDATLRDLPSRGVKKLAVVCPAFVADNLETLEEIAITGRKTFLDAGGETFTLVPCLNDHPAWVDALASICAKALAK